VKSEPDNLKRVHNALARFGAPSHVLRDLENLGPDEVLWMGNPPVRVDILQNVDGVEYETAFAGHLKVDWHGVMVTMISLDLIASKRAAGRPQDLVDAENLELRTRGESGDEF
jgi:hypothetical protein